MSVAGFLGAAVALTCGLGFVQTTTSQQDRAGDRPQPCSGFHATTSEACDVQWQWSIILGRVAEVKHAFPGAGSDRADSAVVQLLVSFPAI